MAGIIDPNQNAQDFNPFGGDGSTSGTDATVAGQNRTIGITAMLQDTDTKAIPNIIDKFRKGRLSIGYDEPTYFGFAIDINSQATEAAYLYNPYTGLRASPLFYLPEWANIKDGQGKMAVNTGENFTQLSESADEASAIQFLNSFTLPLSETRDEYLPNDLILRSKSKESVNRPATDGELNRGYYLREFITVLNSIQEKTPWVFKEFEGMASLWKAGRSGQDFKPVEITINCEETVDLRLTRLAEMYQLFSYDSYNGRKNLPPNLEKFSMDVYYLDLRFLKHAAAEGAFTNGYRTPDYNQSFSGQVNFGGIAFRCFGCRFDFSNFLENSTQVKSATGETSFQPKIKIIIDRVMPASYFGDKAFGIAGFVDDEDSPSRTFDNTLGGALNLGPFTGGVNRVLEAGRRSLTNILGAPQRALNDALLGIQRRFEGAVDNLLGQGPLSSRPFEKKAVETLLNERKAAPISSDIFPGVDNRKANPIKSDIFPGVDIRKTNPIKRDEFLGKDVRTAAPIKNDVFPGVSSPASGKINQDVFPGDKPVLTVINQRKTGGKINSQNPYKP